MPFTKLDGNQEVFIPISMNAYATSRIFSPWWMSMIGPEIQTQLYINDNQKYITVLLRCRGFEKNMTAMLTKYQFLCIAQGSKWALNENFSASRFWEILILEYLLYKGKLILRGNLKVFWPWITYLSKIFKKDYWWTTQILIWDQLK